MIQVSQLRKEYGNLTAVDDLSFDLVPGEILGFLGPNGAGKSTTMKMLTGFLTPTAGKVSIWGCDLLQDALAAQSHIGYLPEGAPCYEEMTPAGFLAFIAAVRTAHQGVLQGGDTRRNKKPRGERAREQAAMVERVVEIMSLGRVLHQRIETLSKGYKRRVGLAQAILHDPDVLILDEPTDGLDPNQKHQVREMIKGLSGDRIVIISTHILEEVTAVCNRAMVLAEGKIVSDSTPAELLASSDWHGAVSLTFEADPIPDDAVILLRGLTGVKDVVADAGALVVFPEAGRVNLSADIQVLVRERDWRLSSLHVEQGRLDEVFRKLTQGATA